MSRYFFDKEGDNSILDNGISMYKGFEVRRIKEVWVIGLDLFR